MNFFGCAPRQSHEDHANGPIAETCIQGWLVQSPEDEPSIAFYRSCAFYRPTWKRRYFVLSLVKAPSTCMQNHYQLRCYSNQNCTAAKGSIGLHSVTDLCTMVLPPDHLLDRLDYKYYYQHQVQQLELPLHQQRDICSQLPIFSFEAEWRRVRRKFYLLADDPRDMLKWFRCLQDACGLADRQEDEATLLGMPQQLSPQPQPLTSSPQLPHPKQQLQPPVRAHQDEDEGDGIYRGLLSPDEGGDEDGIYLRTNARQAVSGVMPETTEYQSGNLDPHGNKFHVPGATEDKYGVPAATECEYGVPAATECEYGVPAATEDDYGVPAVTEDDYGVPAVPEDEYGVPAVTEDEYGVPAATEDEYGVPPATEDVYGEPSARQSLRRKSNSRGGLRGSERSAQQEPDQLPPPDVTPRQFKAFPASPAADEAPRDAAEVTNNTDYENLSFIIRAINAAEPEKEVCDDANGNLS